MRKRCPCGGSNSDCYRCSGCGYVGESFPSVTLVRNTIPSGALINPQSEPASGVPHTRWGKADIFAQKAYEKFCSQMRKLEQQSEIKFN